jgi:hypothetical protein
MEFKKGYEVSHDTQELILFCCDGVSHLINLFDEGTVEHEVVKYVNCKILPQFLELKGNVEQTNKLVQEIKQLENSIEALKVQLTKKRSEALALIESHEDL